MNLAFWIDDRRRMDRHREGNLQFGNFVICNLGSRLPFSTQITNYKLEVTNSLPGSPSFPRPSLAEPVGTSPSPRTPLCRLHTPCLPDGPPGSAKPSPR